MPGQVDDARRLDNCRTIEVQLTGGEVEKLMAQLDSSYGGSYRAGIGDLRRALRDVSEPSYS